MKTNTEMKTIGYVVDCMEDIEMENVTETKNTELRDKVLHVMDEVTKPFERPVNTISSGFWHCVQGQLEIVVGYADLALTAGNQVVGLGYKVIDYIGTNSPAVWK